MLEELYRGRLRWDLLHPFPEEDEQDLLAGDAAVREVQALLRERVDPDEIARTGAIPDEVIGLLRERGYFNLLVADGGGLDLTPMNALRVIEAFAAWSPALALLVGNSNGFGAACYLPLLEPGELRDLVERHVKAGSIGGTADTEVIGAANEDRTTRAELVEDGAAYLINGEKLYIGTGMAAHLLDVSATVTTDGHKQIRVFFVETDAPGVSLSQQDFMGLHGAPLAVVRFDNVRVPAGQLLPADVDAWRDDAALVRLAVLGRMLTVAPPSMAITKLCLAWSREFVARRAIDGRGLGEYEEIKRHLAQTAADAYAIESIVLWGLLSGNLAERNPELTVAKNVISLACWTAIDRTVSLFAAEGYETAASKGRRGGHPIPLERFYRDARSVRISGGVDFLLDIWTAVGALQGAYGPAAADPGPAGGATVTEPALPPRCRQHLAFLQDQAGELAAECRRLVADGLGGGWTDATVRSEHRLMLVGRISGLLLAMAVVLARTAQLAERGDELAGELADLACVDYRTQLAGAWAELHADPAPDYSTVSDHVLGGGSFAALFGEIRA